MHSTSSLGKNWPAINHEKTQSKNSLNRTPVDRRMQQVNINALDLQSITRLSYGPFKIGMKRTPWYRKEFGHEDKLGFLACILLTARNSSKCRRTVPQQSAESLFGCPSAISFGRVNQGHARVLDCIQDFLAFLFGNASRPVNNLVVDPRCAPLERPDRQQHLETEAATTAAVHGSGCSSNMVRHYGLASDNLRGFARHD